MACLPADLAAAPASPAYSALRPLPKVIEIRGGALRVECVGAMPDPVEVEEGKLVLIPSNVREDDPHAPPPTETFQVVPERGILGRLHIDSHHDRELPSTHDGIVLEGKPGRAVEIEFVAIPAMGHDVGKHGFDLLPALRGNGALQRLGGRIEDKKADENHGNRRCAIPGDAGDDRGALSDKQDQQGDGKEKQPAAKRVLLECRSEKGKSKWGNHEPKSTAVSQERNGTSHGKRKHS